MTGDGWPRGRVGGWGRVSKVAGRAGRVLPARRFAPVTSGADVWVKVEPSPGGHPVGRFWFCQPAAWARRGKPCETGLARSCTSTQNPVKAECRYSAARRAREGAKALGAPGVRNANVPSVNRPLPDRGRRGRSATPATNRGGRQNKGGPSPDRTRPGYRAHQPSSPFHAGGEDRSAERPGPLEAVFPGEKKARSGADTKSRKERRRGNSAWRSLARVLRPAAHGEKKVTHRTWSGA